MPSPRTWLEVNKEYADKKREEFGIRYSGEPADSVDWMVDIMGEQRGGAWQVPRELRVLPSWGAKSISAARVFGTGCQGKVACVMGGEYQDTRGGECLLKWCPSWGAWSQRLCRPGWWSEDHH